ncbi:hypothetical protein PAEPH01_0314 [Pancytospora epiphaga]|nr:hypothetical protein PAEPH01_0314 [Pancytospora epiphaga]
MENSFSLEFNPLTNVRAVKEYEEEIQRLKREVFELKTRLTHTSSHPAAENFPKLLYEQNERLAQVSQEKLSAEKQLEETRAMLNQTAQDKMLIENKYNQDIFAANDKIALLEDENKRLLLRIEKLVKEAQDIGGLRTSNQELEVACTNYKNFINNLESQLEQTKYEFNKQIQEYEGRLEEMRQYGQTDANNKRYEVESLRKQLEKEVSSNKNNQLIINDLKETASSEIKERNRLQKELNAVESKQNTMEHRISKECEAFVSGMGRFKTLMKEKLDGINRGMEALDTRLDVVLQKTVLSAENIAFVTRMKIVYESYDDLVRGFKGIISELFKKTELFKKEASDATFFAENNQKHMENKTLKLLEEFHKQFSEAKTELSFCKKYLVKKSEENKNLKNENIRLLRQLESGRLGMKTNIFSGIPVASQKSI